MENATKPNDNPRAVNLTGADTPPLAVPAYANPLAVQRAFQEAINGGHVSEEIAVAIMETCIDFLMKSGYFERDGKKWLNLYGLAEGETG